MLRCALLFFILASCAACKTIGPCDFSPSANGWRSIIKAPTELVDAAGQSADWYVNGNGDYLACFNSRGRDSCGSIYDVYVKAGSTYVRTESIVCLTMRVPPNSSFKPKPLRGSA